MDELVKTFHIDWKLLIAQMVNFLIVLSVLYFFAMKPLMKMMRERSQKIDGGLKNAEEMEKRLQALEQEKQKVINQARQEASLIISNTEKDAEKIRQDKIEKTRAEAEKVVSDAKLEIQSERKSMIQSVKRELGELILLASNKIVSQTMDDKKQTKLIDQVIEDLKDVKVKK
jgi:F-type H+-transporting ATPase subunit b